MCAETFCNKKNKQKHSNEKCIINLNNLVNNLVNLHTVSIAFYYCFTRRVYQSNRLNTVFILFIIILFYFHFSSIVSSLETHERQLNDNIKNIMWLTKKKIKIIINEYRLPRLYYFDISRPIYDFISYFCI